MIDNLPHGDRPVLGHSQDFVWEPYYVYHDERREIEYSRLPGGEGVAAQVPERRPENRERLRRRPTINTM